MKGENRKIGTNNIEAKKKNGTRKDEKRLSDEYGKRLEPKN